MRAGSLAALSAFAALKSRPSLHLLVVLRREPEVADFSLGQLPFRVVAPGGHEEIKAGPMASRKVAAAAEKRVASADRPAVVGQRAAPIKRLGVGAHPIAEIADATAILKFGPLGQKLAPVTYRSDQETRRQQPSR